MRSPEQTAQPRLGAPGSPSRGEHKRDVRQSRTGARANQTDHAALRRFFNRLCTDLDVRAEIGVRLMDDAGIQRLNRDFRHHDTPTDVLSFPASDLATPGGNYLGDIAISRDTAARQARAQGHSLDTEIKILLLHGVLHLLGHDHETDGGAMRRRERALRLQYGLPPGLIERGLIERGGRRKMGA